MTLPPCCGLKELRYTTSAVHQMLVIRVVTRSSSINCRTHLEVLSHKP